MKQRTCFVICPIGDEGSDVRNDADLLHDFIIKPVLAEPPFSMDVTRADKLGEPGIITNQIIHSIETADLVVADLSLGNPNVFYELAIRHVTRMPFVHLVRRGDRIPFDNAPVRAIEFDLRDLRSVDSAKADLRVHAEAALAKGTSESPISIAVTVEALRESGNLDKIALADILAEMAALRGAIDRVASNQVAAENQPSALAALFANTPGPAKPASALTLGELLATYGSEEGAPKSALGSLASTLAARDADRKK